MLELHGLLNAMDFNVSLEGLKRQILLFDQLEIFLLEDAIEAADTDKRASLEFLQSRHVIRTFMRPISQAKREQHRNELVWHAQRIATESRNHPDWPRIAARDIVTRYLCSWYENGANIVPICELPLQENFSREPEVSRNTVLRIGVNALPVPDETAALEDILQFRTDSKAKLWLFRRFLRDLSAKPFTEAEARDEVEGMLHEYSEAMKAHDIKARTGFFEVYILPVIEIAEDIAKFNWSKIAKGALSVKKRQIELMEAEMKAPGRECAYVFEARKRFGSTNNE